MGKNNIIRQLFIWGDRIMSLIALIFVILDGVGAINQWFPNLNNSSITRIILIVFIAYHLFQKEVFFANRPKLAIKTWGWEEVNNGERLYVNVENNPIFPLIEANSISTCSIITIFNKQLTKKIDEYNDVRWQGTYPPIKDKDYQPYDYWCTKIESGRTRRLYIGARKNKGGDIFTVSDRNYLVSGFKITKGKRLPKKAYIRIILHASNFDPKSTWI